jgi:pyridoxamine 5'-phosphate oxidase-like protein
MRHLLGAGSAPVHCHDPQRGERVDAGTAIRYSMNWAEFEEAAPDLAHNGRERFERTRVALIGTLRPDGSPRISPIEPYLLSDRLVIGVMRSAKGHDLLRDGRCTLHSAVSDVNGSDGEFKLRGYQRV